VVIGGGPAGATVAGLLASWGRSVVLVHKEAPQPSLAESLPSSTRKLLRYVGQLDAMEAGRFYPNYGNISRWAGKQAVATTTEPGYHVSRARFDRLLRQHARSCGAAILNGAVHTVELSNTTIVECLQGSRLSRYRADFVLDCSGRAGIIARRGLRRPATSYRTLAITAEWQCDDWPDEERQHTFVDSYADGWAWSVPLSAKRRQCTVMLDADRTVIRKSALASLYNRELRKAVNISQRLARCTQAGQSWACDASLYDCSRATDGRAILVGDAASFIEPLSSAGVKKAVASAWRAAVLVHTCLTKPHMLGPASDFHDRREQYVYNECLRRSAGFFRDAARVHEHPFWSSRARASSIAPVSGHEGLGEADPLRDEAVMHAFANLRDTVTLCLKPAPNLRVHPAPTIEGREIVLRDAVVIPGLEEPLRFWVGVNLPELVRIAADSADVATLIETYHRQVASIDPRSLLLGLSLVTARGLMISTNPAART
jgi:flavin-dependent dehydrogenase